MADIFGVNKSETGGVMSFQDVMLSIKGQPVKLCQQAVLQYQRTITPVMAVGLSTIFLAPQPGQGTLQVTRAIGQGGNMSQDIKNKSLPCEPVNFRVSKGEAGTCPGNGTPGVQGKGIVNGYSFNLNVGGGVTVTDGMSLYVVDVWNG